MQRTILFLSMLVILLASCAPVPRPAAPGAPTATATPDPLYSINCPHNIRDNFFCYPGEKLLGDNALLEKAAHDFCLQKLLARCSLFIWTDEASVGQSLPLTVSQTDSLLTRYLRSFITYETCFKVFEAGETVYTSGTCAQ